MSDDWKTGVDQQLERLHGDVRMLIIAICTATLLVLGALATGYMSLRTEVGTLQAQTSKIEGKLDVLVDQSRASPTPSK